MDLKKYNIFKDNITTIKETSKDDTTEEYMTESTKEAINFDSVKRSYTNSFHSSEDAATSVDAILQKQDGVVFVEFKNGKMSNSTRINIKRKISDSLLIFNDIVKTGLDERRKNTDFILVYNFDKNANSIRENGEIQESKSKIKIKQYFGNKAGKEIIYFGLESLNKLYFKEVHTYQKEEFEEYLNNL